MQDPQALLDGRLGADAEAEAGNLVGDYTFSARQSGKEIEDEMREDEGKIGENKKKKKKKKKKRKKEKKKKKKKKKK